MGCDAIELGAMPPCLAPEGQALGAREGRMLGSCLCDLEICLGRAVSERSFVHIELLNIL